MIYETAIIVRPDAGEAAFAAVKNIVAEVVAAAKGELLVQDDWGVKSFAQATSNGKTHGHYVYFMYQADGTVNKEIDRRLGINENVIRHLIVVLGEDRYKETLVKGYINPNQTVKSGDDEMEFDSDKERKAFQKKKSCWFSAKKTHPDWKDPKSYQWLVNEFGKISPARVTGLRPVFQREATLAIKRGRTMGLISYLSNDVAR